VTAAFVLDHRLEQSSFFIEDWELCRVTLKNDKTWPWLYLVPQFNNIREICDLTAADQAQLMLEISTASRGLRTLYRPEKINIAALGNMVPQLHIHVFARFKNDPAWPKPVWAVQQDEISYTDPEAKTEIEKLKNYFGRMRDAGE
jgi:diadenosine tetraphosphate (Ap4A) HIT family hydrolase